MGTRRKKRKDAGTIIFRLIGIELLVLVVAMVILGIIYLPGVIEILRGSGAGEAIGNKISSVFTPGSGESDQNTQNLPDASNESEPAAVTSNSVQTTEAVQTTSPQEPEVTEAEITLISVGDNLMHRSATLSGLQADGSYSYYANFCNTQQIFKEADIAVLSQDTVMAGSEYGETEGTIFTTHLEIGNGIADAGFNVVLAANNHILDKGRDGLNNMIRFWKDNYPEISLLGVNESTEEKNTPVYVEKNGIKLALINYTCRTNYTEPLESEPYLLNMEDSEWLASIVTQAKEEADFIIAFPHWGTQNSFEVTADQETKAQELADLGVDLVIGAYPHVVEPVQWLTGKDGNQTLVYYSLGNFQSIQDKKENMLGGLADITITKTNRRTYISSYDLDFVVTHYAMQNTSLGYFDVVTTFPWSQYSQELADQHGILAWDSSFSYDSLDAIRKDILSKSELE